MKRIVPLWRMQAQIQRTGKFLRTYISSVLSEGCGVPRDERRPVVQSIQCNGSSWLTIYRTRSMLLYKHVNQTANAWCVCGLELTSIPLKITLTPQAAHDMILARRTALDGIVRLLTAKQRSKVTATIKKPDKYWPRLLKNATAMQAISDAIQDGHSEVKLSILIQLTWNIFIRTFEQTWRSGFSGSQVQTMLTCFGRKKQVTSKSATTNLRRRICSVQSGSRSLILIAEQENE